LESLDGTEELENLVKATATLVARMVAGDTVGEIMNEMHSRQGVYTNGFSTDCCVLVDGTTSTTVRTLHYQQSPIPDESHLLKLLVDPLAIEAVVIAEVASVVSH
jgi:hypothetical protein